MPYTLYEPEVSPTTGDPSSQIAHYASTYGVPVDIATNLAQAESGMQHYDKPGQVKRSSAGAIGMFQIMPNTAKELNINPEDQAQNIEGGIRHLRSLYTEFQDWKLAVAAYNAGSTAIHSAHGVPNYPETQAYVNRIMQGTTHPQQEQPKPTKSASGWRMYQPDDTTGTEAPKSVAQAATVPTTLKGQPSILPRTPINKPLPSFMDMIQQSIQGLTAEGEPLAEADPLSAAAAAAVSAGKTLVGSVGTAFGGIGAQIQKSALQLAGARPEETSTEFLVRQGMHPEAAAAAGAAFETATDFVGPTLPFKGLAIAKNAIAAATEAAPRILEAMPKVATIDPVTRIPITRPIEQLATFAPKLTQRIAIIDNPAGLDHIAAEIEKTTTRVPGPIAGGADKTVVDTIHDAALKTARAGQDYAQASRFIGRTALEEYAKPFYRRISNMAGGKGKELVDMSGKAYNLERQYVGPGIAMVENTFKDWTEAEKSLFLEKFVQQREGVPGHMFSPKEQTAATRFTNYLDNTVRQQIDETERDMGVQIIPHTDPVTGAPGVRGMQQLELGGTPPTPGSDPRWIENYWPQRFDLETLAKGAPGPRGSSQYSNYVIDKMVKGDPNMTRGQAQLLLQKYIRDNREGRPFGNLERTREGIASHGIRKDHLTELTDYIQGTGRRLAQIRAYGGLEHEGANAVIRGLEAAGEDPTLIREWFGLATGNHQFPDARMQEFAGQITDIELASKLGFVSVRHASQPLLQLLVSDGDFKSLITGFLQKSTPENKILMQEAGLGLNRALEQMQTLRQSTGMETGESGELGGSIKGLRKAVMSPLDWIMNKNRAWAAASGRLHLLEVVGKGKTDELGRMGFSADDLERLSQGTTFEQRIGNVARQDEIRAAQYMHDQVMLERPAGYMPRQYYVSQGIRMAYLLKGFGLKLTDFLFDNLVKTPTAKKVAIMGAVFPAVGSVMHDAYLDLHHPVETGQAILNRGPVGAEDVASKYRHADGFVRYMDGISFFGGLGIFSEMFNVVSSIANTAGPGGVGTSADRAMTAIHAIETAAGPVWGNAFRVMLDAVSAGYDANTAYHRMHMSVQEQAQLQEKIATGRAGPVQFGGLRDLGRLATGELPFPASQLSTAPIFANPRAHQIQMEKNIGLAFKRGDMKQFEQLLNQYMQQYHKAPPAKTMEK